MNAIDPGRYKMVKKGNKVVPVYVAKLERTLKRQCTDKNRITGLRCGNPPIKGGTVCKKHGGDLPSVQDKAAERLLEAENLWAAELIPTIKRLRDIRDQDDHMPSALGASKEFINRVQGKVGDKTKDEEGNKGQTINIGIAFGGIPKMNQKLLGEPTIEAEVVTPPDDEFEEGSMFEEDDEE